MSLYVNINFYSRRFADRPVATLFLYWNMLRKSWDSSVSVVSRLRAGRSGVQIRAMTKLFIFSKRPYPLWGVGDSFPRGKFGADRCPLHAVEVKKECRSTPPHVFIACTRKTLFTVYIGGLEHLNGYSSLIPYDFSFGTSHTKSASRPLSLVDVLFAETVAVYTLFVQRFASSELQSAFRVSF